jgi:hypothetical protein
LRKRFGNCVERLRANALSALLAANLPVVADDLEAGAIAIIARGRMRIRSLPVVPRRLTPRGARAAESTRAHSRPI